jgi:peroxiredoxin
MCFKPQEELTSRTRRALLKGCTATLITLSAVRVRPAQANDLHVGAPAPLATLVTLDRRRISTAELLGNVVVLAFWATWCAPCRAELPLLSSYAARHAGAGLRVLGFSLDTPGTMREVHQVAQALRFPVGLLSDSSAPGYGRIWRLPVSFTIDRAGRLSSDGWKQRQAAWTADRLEEIVAPLLREPD